MLFYPLSLSSEKISRQAWALSPSDPMRKNPGISRYPSGSVPWAMQNGSFLREPRPEGQVGQNPWIPGSDP